MPLRDLPPPGLRSEVPCAPVRRRSALPPSPPRSGGFCWLAWWSPSWKGSRGGRGCAWRLHAWPHTHLDGGEAALLGDTQTLHVCHSPQEIASVGFGSHGLGDNLSDLSNMLLPQVSSVYEARCTVERTPGAAPRGAHRKRRSSASSGSEDTGSDGAGEWADPGEEELFSRTHL